MEEIVQPSHSNQIQTILHLEQKHCSRTSPDSNCSRRSSRSLVSNRPFHFCRELHDIPGMYMVHLSGTCLLNTFQTSSLMGHLFLGHKPFFLKKKILKMKINQYTLPRNKFFFFFLLKKN